MKHKFFALGAFILFALSACQQNGKGSGNPLDETNASTLAGFWIPIDFCTRSGKAGSVLKAMNNSNKPYAYALSFNASNPDSITCYNGIETWKMKADYRDDTLEIKNAHGNLSIYLVYDPKDNKDLTMFDGTSGNTNLNRYILSKAKVLNGYEAFLTALNNSMMSGSFRSAGKGGGEVRFGTDGTIKGNKDFDLYQLCTGGDCAVMSDMDVITLRNSKKAGSDQMFGYVFSTKKDTLTFYNLINQNPAEKGNYAVGSVAQTYLKTIAKK